MLEIDVYDPLSNWAKNKFGVNWNQTTHEIPCIVINDDNDEETAETDICLGNKKRNILELTDIIHVKTKDNLQNKKDRYELTGKAKYTLKGSPKVWIAIEQSTFSSVIDGLDDKIGVITYEEIGNTATRFKIKKDAVVDKLPKFLKQTEIILNQKFSKIIETTPNYFICSLNQGNWEICKQHKLWGVPENAGAAESAIKRAKLGDHILFRLNKGPDYVAIWMVTSEPFQDKQGGPWKKQNPNETRNFLWQVKMHPLLIEEFSNPVKLKYVNGIDAETEITTKSYMSGMVEITDNQYRIISKKLIDKNQKQLN